MSQPGTSQPCRIVGEVFIDLTTVEDRSRLRHRAAAIDEVPNGGTFVVYIGAMPVEPTVVHVLHPHTERLGQIKVSGHDAFVVSQWMQAILQGEAYLS